MAIESYLEAIRPELMNVTRLFALPDTDWDLPRYTFTMTEEDGRYVCRFRAEDRQREGSVPIPDAEEERLRELHRKRAVRRLCKQTLYDLCRELTGIHRPGAA